MVYIIQQRHKRALFGVNSSAIRYTYIIKHIMSVCLLPMAGRTAKLPIKTKLGIGTQVDPRSVLVKVKVMWCHLVNA